MRIVHRIVTLAALGAFGIALSACTDFDPDKLDVFHLNEKKKLPGERKELFPGGVPGVTQGIPQEYMMGNQPQPETAQAPTPEQPKPAAEAATEKKTAAVEAEPEPKPKPKAKRKPKPHPAANPAQQPQQASGQTQPPAWPQDQQAAPQQAQSPWPAQQGQASTAAPWPSAPAPGTFSR